MPSLSCRPLALFVLAWPLACGPKPAGETTGTTGGSSTSTDTTGTVTTSSTNDSTTADPTTTANPTTAVDTGESSSTTTQGFIMVPDVGPACFGIVAKECDPWAQDCPAGEKCVPASDGCDYYTRTRCVPVARDPAPLGGACTTEGEPLSGFDDCDLGAVCWQVDPDTLSGTCFSMCHGWLDAPDCSHVPGSSCVFIFNVPAALCLPSCDPLQQNCPEGHLCHPNPVQPEAFACLPDTSGESGAAFAPCQTSGCDPGLACVDPGAAVECAPDNNCCTPFCALDAPACPGAGQVCQPYFAMGQDPIGLENVGLCRLP